MNFITSNNIQTICPFELIVSYKIYIARPACYVNFVIECFSFFFIWLLQLVILLDFLLLVIISWLFHAPYHALFFHHHHFQHFVLGCFLHLQKDKIYNCYISSLQEGKMFKDLKSVGQKFGQNRTKHCWLVYSSAILCSKSLLISKII